MKSKELMTELLECLEIEVDENDITAEHADNYLTDISLLDESPQKLTLHIQTESTTWGVTYDMLQRIAETCGSKEINIRGVEYYPGCETCDYGATTETFIEVKNPKFERFA